MRSIRAAIFTLALALNASAGDCRFTRIAHYPDFKGLSLVARDGLLIVGNPADLYVIDASDVRNLQLRSKFYAVANAGLDHDGRYLATASKAFASVRLFDLANPSAPIELPPLSLPKVPTDVSVDDGSLYTVDNDAIVRAFTIDAGGIHIQRWTYTYPKSYPGSFCIARQGLLLTENGRLLSVEDPAKPQLLSIINVYSCSNESPPALIGQRAMIGSQWSFCNSVELHDVSDPTNPQYIASASGNYYSMAHFTPIQDLFAGWSMTWDKQPVIPIITVFEPSEPGAGPVGTIKSQLKATLGSDGQHLFVCDFYDGLQVFSVDPCYANCDCNASALDIDDFICFQTRFALSDPYADCDADGSLTIDDFVCFQAAYAMGC